MQCRPTTLQRNFLGSEREPHTPPTTELATYSSAFGGDQEARRELKNSPKERHANLGDIHCLLFTTSSPRKQIWKKRKSPTYGKRSLFLTTSLSTSSLFARTYLHVVCLANSQMLFKQYRRMYSHLDDRAHCLLLWLHPKPAVRACCKVHLPFYDSKSSHEMPLRDGCKRCSFQPRFSIVSLLRTTIQAQSNPQTHQEEAILLAPSTPRHTFFTRLLSTHAGWPPQANKNQHFLHTENIQANAAKPSQREQCGNLYNMKKKGSCRGCSRVYCIVRTTVPPTLLSTSPKNTGEHPPRHTVFHASYLRGNPSENFGAVLLIHIVPPSATIHHGAYPCEASFTRRKLSTNPIRQWAFSSFKTTLYILPHTPFTLHIEAHPP